jgi:hypothetical protein
MDNSGTRLGDRQDIYDVVLRYCRGVDRLDMGLVRSAYHPEGIDHHTGFSGPINDYIVWVNEALRRFNGTMHIIGNHMAEINADRAVVESYGTAVHWGDPPDDPRRNFTTGFRYVDYMTRRDGRWAIDERWAVREWTRSDAGRYVAKEGVGPSPGRGDGEDPLWRLKRRLGFG